MKTKVRTSKRVNVIFPQETLQMIDKVVKHGNRSSLIDEAVRFYIDEIGKTNLRSRLKEGAQKRKHRDLEVTKEWFLTEKEAWQNK